MDVQRDTFVSPFPWPGVEIVDASGLEALVEEGASPWADPEPEFDPSDYLHLLPEVEAEIVYMVRLRKRQRDIGALLGISQPTVNYHYQRAIEKIRYLVTLAAVDVEGIVAGFDFLSEKQRAILVDLFYSCHQMAVARKHGVSQSSVRWVAIRARQELEKREREEPERWFNALGLVLLLWRHLGLRVR